MFAVNTNPRRAKIEAAGYQYPMAWDEMGSSEKDMWEERKLAAIARREACAGN